MANSADPSRVTVSRAHQVRGLVLQDAVCPSPACTAWKTAVRGEAGPEGAAGTQAGGVTEKVENTSKLSEKWLLRDFALKANWPDCWQISTGPW